MRDVVKVFENYFATIVTANQLALERADDDAQRLINLRRDLAQKTFDVQRVVDDFAKAHHFDEATVPLLREHRSMFSAERGAVSLHQAKWTAPAMLANRDGYEADVRALFKMHEDNHRWRMHNLVPALKTGIAS